MGRENFSALVVRESVHNERAELFQGKLILLCAEQIPRQLRAMHNTCLSESIPSSFTYERETKTERKYTVEVLTIEHMIGSQMKRRRMRTHFKYL